MTEFNNHLHTIQEAGVATLRSRLNQLLNNIGLGAALGGASLTSIIIIGFLAINLLFVLNIACGLLLGEVFGSLGLGFLALVGIYIVLIIAYLIIKPIVEKFVQARVARKMHHITDNINNNLSQVPELQVAHQYREAYISSEPFPYQALRLRRDEAIKQANKAGEDIREGVQYIRHNYHYIFGRTMEQNIPGYRYISPFINERRSQQRESKKPNAVEAFINKNAQSLKPYLPYFGTAFTFLRPIVSAFLVNKTQSWLLGKLLGISRKKKK